MLYVVLCTNKGLYCTRNTVIGKENTLTNLLVFPHTENGVFSRNIVTCTTVAGVTKVTVFAVKNITCFRSFSG